MYSGSSIPIHSLAVLEQYLLRTRDGQLKFGWMSTRITITPKFHWRKLFLSESKGNTFSGSIGFAINRNRIFLTVSKIDWRFEETFSVNLSNGI